MGGSEIGAWSVFDPPPKEIRKYKTFTLRQTWGEEEVRVRLFPPCEVKEIIHRNGAVVVFVKSTKGRWVSKRIGYADFFPLNGFIAWDDKNNEYAWHNVGSIDVPTAKDPTMFKAIIRGESETVGGGPRPEPRDPGHAAPPGPKRKRRRFMDWFLGHSKANSTPDFLRKDIT